MTEFGAFLLPVAPLIGLLVFLLLGRYPGCEAIVRLSQRIEGRPSPWLDRPACARLPKPPRSFAPAGGLVIAFGLARRPPPLPA